MIHHRLLDILNEFLKTPSGLNRSFLSKMLNVSTKTIQNDIKALNEHITPIGAKIESKRGNGYNLKIENQKDFQQFCIKFFQLHTDKVMTTQEERLTFILQRLLTSREFIKLNDLAEELYLSKATINLLMKDVTTILKEYDLSIEKRPYYGIHIKGNEFSIRSCISQHLLHRDINFPLFENKNGAEKKLLAQDLYIIKDTILECIKNTNVYLSDLEFDNLVIHIAIAIRRIKGRHYIQSLSPNIQDVQDTYEFKIAHNILERLEKILKFTFPIEEVLYVAIHLLGMKVTSAIKGESLKDIIGEQTYNILEEIIMAVDNNMGYNFKNDRELLFALGLHIKAQINRIKYGLNIRNPLLEDIKNRYPFALEIAVEASKILDQYIGKPISENETGYIAIHFGAAIDRLKTKLKPKRCLLVCASGLGSAQLIKNKILESFKDKIIIAGITGFYQLQAEKILQEKIDLVISTVNITMPLPVPVVKVHSIFNNSDIKAIQKKLGYEVNEHLKKYIDRDLIFPQQEIASREEVIRFLCQKVSDLDGTKEDLNEAVIKREKASATSFGNLVAIPHPIKPLSNKTILAFCTLKKPIMWGEQSVQFICLLCVKRGNNRDLQRLYDSLYDIINDLQMVERLINTTKIKTFEETLLSSQLETSVT
ncbi:BglG family transcriptional antiterminator [Scopulibacillus darangshiensis]|uniref:BglG family transcriptional antiterminator n=1 Tax=Scopulibacillus darangshiensis TaxID=442528 RepID=A0A4R2NID5_9BACL|nr:BglG family transcription antiterminator [Scopulibacillus darangshiensis]TCP21177.1 BglG family transcriptional antiterminator [Scopulibacillus darangshiensis]